MILTCPECASRYFVDDARIGPDGRKVRCASCGHSWRQAGASPTAFDTPLTLAPDYAPSAPPPVTSEVSEPPVKLRGASADVSSRLRKAAHEKRQTREAAAVGAIWAVLGAGFVVLALVAVIFRTDVVRLMPMTAGAYAFARMPVNPIGLAIEGVTGGPGLQDGRASLKVSGVERNVETHARDAAPLRISLLDKAGHKLVSQVAAPASGPIQPGETRPFSLSFLDPPLQAASFQVEFDFASMAPKTPAAAPARHGAVAKPVPAAPPTAAETLQLRGSAPAPAAPPVAAKEAAPLPANSPYALPKAAERPHG